MNYRLVVVRGRSASQAIPLKDAITVAGRQEDCQLRISSSQVSRRHCQFFEQKGYLIVKDLGSSNGTLVNGKKISGQRVLEHNDVVNIGPIEFRVEKLQQQEAPKKPGPGDTAVPATSDEGAIPFDDELIQVDIEESAPPAAPTVASTPAVAKPPAAKVNGPAAPANASKSPANNEEPTIEFGEEDVADFLLELDIDDDGDAKKKK
jgi:pSer/pThr/pTyr-binding forkhead associated (FHA) protein